MSELQTGSARTLASDVNKGSLRESKSYKDEQYVPEVDSSKEDISKEDTLDQNPLSGEVVERQEILEKQLTKVGSSAARGPDDTRRGNNPLGVVGGVDYAGASSKEEVAEIDNDKLAEVLRQADPNTLSALKESAVLEPSEQVQRDDNSVDVLVPAVQQQTTAEKADDRIQKIEETPKEDLGSRDSSIVSGPDGTPAVDTQEESRTR